jgi:hypothetical protein
VEWPSVEVTATELVFSASGIGDPSFFLSGEPAVDTGYLFRPALALTVLEV